MSRFARLIPPTDPAATEDAFAECAPEPAATTEAAEERDWFAAFPEEAGVHATQRRHLLAVPDENHVPHDDRVIPRLAFDGRMPRDLRG